MHPLRRKPFWTLVERLREPRRLIQIVYGPRQVGKTTMIRQVLSEAGLPGDYHLATAEGDHGAAWLQNIWDMARTESTREGEAPRILVIDEIQKIPNWAETIKRLWDQDTVAERRLQVVLLGSSPLLMRRGLTESLAGRFELIRLMHWTWPEMREAFGWDLDRFIFFGGYPGSAEFVDEPERWSSYILDALVEPTLARDIHDLRDIRKPALVRRLYDLSVEYAGQILSYNKMLGQLDDAGNTTTLAEYLTVLGQVGFLTGLEKYDPAAVRRKRSSPKLTVYNMALMTAARPIDFRAARADTRRWGRLVEAAVGAHLINAVAGTRIELGYWRQRNLEVDYVLSGPGGLLAIEVKSGTRSRETRGLRTFQNRYPGARTLVVGGEGMDLRHFFSKTIDELAPELA